MKRGLLCLLILMLSFTAMSQILPSDAGSYITTMYSMMKDSVDFRYDKSFNVSSIGAKFSSINSVLDYAKENKLDTISILIYGNLPAETVKFEGPFRFISICGVNSACNADLSNTVFINTAESIYISLQNLSFKSLRNEGHIAYLGFFHNMIEEMVSEKDVVFSDIFGSEITENFKWPSDGYLAFTQGKGMGKEFYGIISNIYNTSGDSLIIFGYNKTRELYFTNNFTFSRYLHVTGYLNVQNQISIMNGKAVSVLRANEAVLTGDFKARTPTDSIFFKSDSKVAGVTTPWSVKGDLTVEGEGFAKISKDGTFFIKEKNNDSISFKGGRIDISKNDIVGEGNIYMMNYMNPPGKTLTLKYNMGVNDPIRWGIADGDKILDYSILEDSSNSIFVRKEMKPDTLSGYGDIKVFAGAGLWSVKSVKLKKEGVFERIVFDESSILRQDSLFSWDKKTGSVAVKKTGLYYVGYNGTVNCSNENEIKNKAAVRVMKNKFEQKGLNGIISISSKTSQSCISAGCPVKLNQNDTLSVEFYSSNNGISLIADEVFSNESGFVFYIYELK